jgi:hypothetical protein
MLESDMTERRYDDEMYKKHAIRVLAERYDSESDWTIEVHIQAPDGSHLPTIRDSDRSYPTLEMAFATGSELGRQIVDS